MGRWVLRCFRTQLEFNFREGRPLFTELKGGFIIPDKWEIYVIQLPQSEKLEAILKIDCIRFVASDGEVMIGDPRDFNTYDSVLETLRRPSRRM